MTRISYELAGTEQRGLKFCGKVEMMVEESWREWSIIPNYALQGDGEIDVVHFEESLRTGSPVVSLVIAANWREPGSEEYQSGAWRISFQNTLAFRKRPVHYEGNLHLLQPPDFRSIYEIFPSNYLEQSSAPSGIAWFGRPVHHYVIRLNSQEIYEVIAENATNEQIGQEWAYTFSNKPVPRWE
jgi:hypothetical protein